MVVFVDIYNKTVVVYGEKGCTKIPFERIYDIYDIVKKEEVLYITNAINTGVERIVELVKQNTNVEDLPLPPETYSTKKYIHSVVEGTIFINQELQFKGKYDFKLITNEIKKIIQEEPLLKKLIEKGKIKIINELTKTSLEKEKKKKEEERSIILEQSVSEWREGGKEQEGEERAKEAIEHDAIPIDISARGKVDVGRGVSVNTMTELINTIEKLD